MLNKFLNKNTSTDLNINTFYFGTWNNYIFSYNIDFQNKKAVQYQKLTIPPNSQESLSKPSYITLNSEANSLYSIIETQNSNGDVRQIKINNDKQMILLNNKLSSQGAAPANLQLNQKKNLLLLANYNSGSVESVQLDQNGNIEKIVNFDKHPDSEHGPDSNQESSHAHCFVPDNLGKFCYSADLGNDRIYQYQISEDGQFTALQQRSLKFNDGDGPRIITFHPKLNNILYLSTENSVTLYTLQQNPDGTLTQLQSLDIKALLKQVNNTYNSGAHVSVSKNGKYVFFSTRSSIAENNRVYMFPLSETGYVNQENYSVQNTRGFYPRFFSLTSDDKYLIVLNQQTESISSNGKSGNLVVFEIEYEQGQLQYSFEQQIINEENPNEVIQPTCIAEYVNPSLMQEKLI